MWALLGVAVLGLGSAVLLSAHVGVDPFTAANIGASTLLGVDLGVYQLAINAVLLVPVVVWGRRYIGVGTIINMATVYGDTLGLSQMELILALLSTQIIGFPCAIAYGRLAERFGTRKMIGVGIFTYFCICILGYFVNNFPTFLLLAILVGTAQGGIQSLSRSYFGKLIPDPKQANEYFGFYDIFGKFASFIGPALFGTVALATGNSRYGVLSVLLLFALGGILFVVGNRAGKKTA